MRWTTSAAIGAMECRRWVGAASDSQHWWEGAESKRGACVGCQRAREMEGWGKGEKEEDGIGLARADAV